VLRVDDLRGISGIIHVLKRGLQWCDAPSEYGPHKILYNRFVRWSRRSVFDRIFSGLAGAEGVPRRIGQIKGGLNSKLHAVCDGYDRLVVMLLSEGQMSGYTGAKLMLDILRSAKCLLADRVYDADWFRKALKKKVLNLVFRPEKIGRNK